MQNSTQIQKSNLLAEVGLTYKALIPYSERTKISSSEEIYSYLKSIWDDGKIEYVEEMYVVMLNRANQVLGWSKISTGGTTATVCDSKVIFQLALLHNASAIILAHNHPSGNLKQSQQDIDTTRKIVNGGKLLDITVLDHVIVTANGYTSFCDEGLI